MAHHQYMMLHMIYQLRREFTICALYAPSMHPLCALYAPTMRPLCALYCALYAPTMHPLLCPPGTKQKPGKPRVCTLDPNPQVLVQQVLYKPSKQKHPKVKRIVSATQSSNKECHKILQSEDSCYTKVKALKYLDSRQDSKKGTKK